mmetsp:Transcript_26478/g.67784  ORF Transcript_26478/g.67784 Transcript_26478/m.67784 type:complete len:151 (+) Transcript_26478:1826-2278(+)
MTAHDTTHVVIIKRNQAMTLKVLRAGDWPVVRSHSSYTHTSYIDINHYYDTSKGDVPSSSDAFKLEYSFKNAYEVTASIAYISGDVLKSTIEAIGLSDVLYSRFLTFFRVTFNANRLAFLCEMVNAFNSTYQQCYDTFLSAVFIVKCVRF